MNHAEDTAATGHAQLDVRDFGPIARAYIDLRPLTVFVGPSNTGKSYLATLLYALHRCFRQPTSPPHQQHTAWLHALKDTTDAPLQWFIETFASIDPAEPPESITLPPNTTDLLMSAFVLGGHGSGTSEISACFGLDEADLVRRQAKQAEAVFRPPATSDGTGFEHKVVLGAHSHRISGPRHVGPMRVSPGHDATLDLCLLARSLRSRPANAEWYARAGRLVEILRVATLPQIVSPMHLPAFYVPADRIGAMRAHSAVVSGLIGDASRSATSPPVLTGVLGHFLQELLQPQTASDVTFFKPYAARIEETILNGTIVVQRNPDSGYPTFFYHPDGWSTGLPIKNASAMVAELGPIILYLRHLVVPGSLLVIEEPEANLHPAIQVELIRQLASLVNAGVRVLLTTHSEWVLDELSNIVLASALPAEGRSQVPAGEVALNPEDVGVWTFRRLRRPMGTVVDELRLRQSGDLYSAGFDDVSKETYDHWVRIGGLAANDRDTP